MKRPFQLCAKTLRIAKRDEDTGEVDLVLKFDDNRALATVFNIVMKWGETIPPWLCQKGDVVITITKAEP